MQALRDRLINGVVGGIKSVRLNGHPVMRLCNNANFSFHGIEGEALLLRLDANGVACSTGSACSSRSLEPSHVLAALGLEPEDSHGSLRMTLGVGNTGDDIDYAVEALVEEVAKLREISPIRR